MSEPGIQAALNHTDPALAKAAVNLIRVFGLLWALFGLAAPLLLAVLPNHALSPLAARKAA